jgi:CheY-like chemotaxis protein
MKPTGASNHTAQQNILIVDDDPDTCELLDLLFSKKGYHTLVATSGPEALSVIQENRPDICILDVMMPGMDGWETFERVRTFSNIPVLFLTALASGASAARALTVGVNDYVRKPFHPEELVARASALLKIASLAPISANIQMVTPWPSVSVIIPTLNEAENLPLVLPFLPLDWLDEVILVDGQSTDGTVQVAKQLLPSIKVILEEKPGKGAALSTGYHAAKGDILIVLDADGSHDPREIPRFVHALMEGADFAKGSRFAPGGGTTDMPRVRQLGNSFFVFLINTLFNVHFTDLCYGFHAFWSYCLDTITLDDVNGFEIDTAIYLRTLSRQLRVVEVPSFEGYRFRGVGKLRTFPDGWRVLMTIARETWRNFFSPSKEPYEGFRGHSPEDFPMPAASPIKDSEN